MCPARTTSPTSPADLHGHGRSRQQVTLFDGTTVVGTGVATAGTWTITASTLAAGTHSITAKAMDVAGNSSGVSTPLIVVTLDTLPPAVTERLTAIGRLSGTGTQRGADP